MLATDDDEHAEIQSLRERLVQAEEALRAIRAGEVDAIVVDGPDAPVIYTLKNADNAYRLLVEQMREGAMTVSGDGVILYCNSAFSHIVGVPSERLRGTDLNDWIIVPTRLAPGDLLAASGTSGRDICLRTQSGDVRNVYISSAPLAIEGEHVHCVVVTDLTRQELRRRHAAIVSASIDAIYSLTPDGTITTWNRAAEELYGYTAQEILGRNVDVLFSSQPEGKATVSSLLKGERLHHDTVAISKSGKRVDVTISVAPIGNANREVEGISVIASDITERKRALDHIQFLLRETCHRSKNLLAVIQAIARQMTRSADTVDEFRARFNQRLQAIAQCHDLLINEDWKRANLADLMRLQLSPFVEPGLRLKLEGPDVFLKPEAAQSIALALHELATNAAKYGALSVPRGNVTVAWALENNAADHHLHLSWRERDGPRVSPPSYAGFGSRVTTTLIAQSLNGKVETDFAPEGLTWTLDISSSYVINGNR